MTDKVREEFEAWAVSDDFGLTKAHLRKDESGDYINIPTMNYWHAWQASRAALVVELPYVDEGCECELELLRLKVDVMRAIESAGVRVSE